MPDPYDGSYDLGNPQSFNRYAYVLNNPVLLTDASGLDGDGGGGGFICYSAVVQGGVNVANDAGCAAIAVFDYLFFHWLLGGPSFHGSLQPRPETTGQPDFSGPILNEHIGLPAGTPLPEGGFGDLLGFPSSGCDFGNCASLGDSFQGRTPAQNQGPYSIQFLKDAAGKLLTIRLIGGNGKAWADIDVGHNHGSGDPHVHPWDWNKIPPRLPGVRLYPYNIPGPLPIVVQPCITNPAASYCNVFPSGAGPG